MQEYLYSAMFFPVKRLREKMTKVRQRESANKPVDQATLSINERILKECHQLYTDPENGLVNRWIQFLPFLWVLPVHP